MKRQNKKEASDIFLKPSLAARILRGAALCVAAVMLGVGACAVVAATATPDVFRVRPGETLAWRGGVITVRPQYNSGHKADAQASAGFSPEGGTAELLLFNAIPVKQVKLKVLREAGVVPCGTPFGIKLLTNGVVVVGVADIQTDGGTKNPAREAGICVGDIIVAIDGREVLENGQVADIIEASGGKPVRLAMKRGDDCFDVTLTPVKASADGLCKAGLWVRDSTAGIGTVTFYEPKTRAFAGLGHGICDTDTGALMPLRAGEILPVTINGVVKGQCGVPGELRGYFNGETAMGSLYANGPAGVYGILSRPQAGTPVRVALRQEVKRGSAHIITTIDENGPCAYAVQLEAVDYRDETATRNLVLRVTDSRLLAATGGIVQGMSGSPIIQNGMLVGAVTHVFINDPTRGYGIFAENMGEMKDKMMTALPKAS